MVYIPWTIEHLEKGLLLLLLPVLHPFNGFFSRTTWVSRYQKGKTSLDLNEARDDGVSGWWHKLDNVQTICTSLQKFREITTSAAHHSVEGFNRLLVKYEEKNWQAEQVPTLSHYVILACDVKYFLTSTTHDAVIFCLLQVAWLDRSLCTYKRTCVSILIIATAKKAHVMHDCRGKYRERKCADTIGTVPVPWAGHFQS